MSKDKSLDNQIKILEELLALPANKNCADCGERGPRWASINLGVFVCIRCSGIHRSLGVHITKIKSVSLDKWTPEHIKVMQEIGNEKAKEIYEYDVPDNFQRTNTIENWIRAKYDRKEFMKKETKEQKKKTKPETKLTDGPKDRDEKKKQSHAPSQTTTIQSIKSPSENLIFLGEAPKQEIDQFSDFKSANSEPNFKMNTVTPSHLNSENAFFPDKTSASILQLYNAPLVPQQLNFNSNVNTMNQMSPNTPNTPVQKPVNTTFQPNYNVALPGLGLPTNSPTYSPPYGMNTGGYPSTGQGGYPSSGQGGYPSTGQGGYPSTGQGGYPSTGQGSYPNMNGNMNGNLNPNMNSNMNPNMNPNMNGFAFGNQQQQGGYYPNNYVQPTTGYNSSYVNSNYLASIKK